MKKEYSLLEEMKYNKKTQKNKFTHGGMIVKDKPFKQEESSNDKVNGNNHRPDDSPGIDLSVFAPRGKRKCVLQNEAKSHKISEWWSDEEDAEGDNGKVNVIDDVEQDIGTETKDEILRKSSTSKSKRKKLKTSVNGMLDKSVSSPITVHCYVFSTGMANRAGHSVNIGSHKTITEYHQAQHWDTPYLHPEVHCRPFHPELEKEEKAKDLANGRNFVPKTESCKSTGTYIDVQKSSDIKKDDEEKQLFCVDKWQKKQLIQTAREMNRLSEIRDELSLNPLKVEKSDSESSPQTVPKRVEANVEEETASSMSSAANSNSPTVVKTAPHVEDKERKKELNSPLQLVPSITSTSHESTKISTSYPADITNLSKQYSSSKANHHSDSILSNQSDYRLQTSSMQENYIRPTVLSMAVASRSDESVAIRSSLDMAEKELKESRTAYKPGVPILPRDIHPSLFLSRHSPQVRTSTFNGRPATTSVPVFSRSMLRATTSFIPTHDLHARHVPPSHSGHLSLFRHSLHNRPDIHDLETDKHNSVPSSFSVYHALNSRPSSLPVLPTASKRPETHPNKSFTVESLTKTNNERDTLEKSISASVDRVPSVMPEYLREYLAAPDRLRIPTNGISIHDGLKRSLDEQLSNHIMDRVKRDKPYVESVSNERYLHEKDWLMYEEERFLHQQQQARLAAFRDPRSPMRIPPVHTPRHHHTNGTTEDSEKSNSLAHQSSYSRPPRSHQYPFSHR